MSLLGHVNAILGCGDWGPNLVVVGLRTTGAAGLVGRGMVQGKLGDVGIRVEQEQVDRQLRLPEGLHPRHQVSAGEIRPSSKA